MKTQAQKDRQNQRRKNGQYEESEPCDACGKPAGFDYWSMNDRPGQGLTLCNRGRCPANTGKWQPSPVRSQAQIALDRVADSLSGRTINLSKGLVH